MNLNPKAILAIKENPYLFYNLGTIVKEDSSIGKLQLEHQQLQTLDALHNHQHVYVIKYRQAKITTVGLHWLLLNSMLNPQQYGLLVAETAETYKEGFRRLKNSYDLLPSFIKVPATLAGQTHLQFSHGGAIKTITAGSNSPAIGRSPDYIHMTELGLWENSEIAFSNIFPSFNKRPNARSLIETTPGLKDSPSETLWLQSLEGKSRYTPLFLKWWLDPSCTSKRDITLDNEEIKLMESLEGCTKEHIAFRRLALDGEFLGDKNLWENKYPSNEYSGFISTLSPSIPDIYVLPHIRRATPSLPNPHGIFLYEEPIENTPYIICADPAGYGENGDPSAFTVFNCWTKREVASHSGRYTPPQFAELLIKIKKLFNDALLVVESNAAGCISVLDSKGVRLYGNKNGTPGFYMTASNKQEALAHFVRMLKDDEIFILSKDTLHQALRFDGTWKRDKTGHYDKLITCMIASYIFNHHSFGAPPVPKDTRLTAKKFADMRKPETPNPYR